MELLGGILPSDDGQELDESEVAELVARAREEAQNLAMRPSLQPDDLARPQEADVAIGEDIGADLTLDSAGTVRDPIHATMAGARPCGPVPRAEVRGPASTR